LLENAKTELFYGFSGYSVLNEGNGMKLQLKNPTHNAIDFSIESGTWWYGKVGFVSADYLLYNPNSKCAIVYS